jgi:hypothetical protein
MKAIKIISALIIFTSAAMGLRAQSAAKDELIIPLSNPGKPYKLDVGLISGSITVTGYEGKDIAIQIAGDDENKSKDEERENGMRRLSSGNSTDLQAEENNNTVTIHAGRGNKTANLLIKIPMAEVMLKLHTINNGNIMVSNVMGGLEVNNVNGYIKLTNISGSVVANTVNGKVEVVFKSIDPKAAMAFSTLNGNVDVTFPAALKANVKLKSDRGNIYTDFDVAADPHKPSITHSASSGMYSLKIEDWVYGKIDGGGPEIMMKNMNGNIYIRKAK